MHCGRSWDGVRLPTSSNKLPCPPACHLQVLAALLDDWHKSGSNKVLLFSNSVQVRWRGV